jgi:LPS sulfotransferase NodH
MPIDRPIFVLAPPRSGTSLLYKTLCAHPDVAYLSRGYKKYPDHPLFAEALTRLRIVSSGPKEARAVWKRFPDRSTDIARASEVTPEIRDWYRRLVSRLVELRGKERFLAKFPGHSVRAPWIDAIFPDCIFLIVTRDWRSVASSTVVMREKHAGEDAGFWGIRVPGWQEMKKNMGTAESAAHVFRLVHETIDADTAGFAGRVVRIAYEDFCRDVAGEMKRVTAACGLPWSARFEASLPEIRAGTTSKWRRILDPALVERIRAAEGPALARYEHPDVSAAGEADSPDLSPASSGRAPG